MRFKIGEMKDLASASRKEQQQFLDSFDEVLCDIDGKSRIPSKLFVLLYIYFKCIRIFKNF